MMYPCVRENLVQAPSACKGRGRVGKSKRCKPSKTPWSQFINKTELRAEGDGWIASLGVARCESHGHAHPVPYPTRCALFFHGVRPMHSSSASASASSSPPREPRIPRSVQVQVQVQVQEVQVESNPSSAIRRRRIPSRAAA